MLRDKQQRKQATDPRFSFIVQAPAGSGKTELLTQRYLRLLGKVNVPEEILAVTFTRKAASEMRERVLSALQQAATHSLDTGSVHPSYEYALSALSRSEKLGWHILEQPSRLRILTIDALCQMITHILPLSPQCNPYATITDKPVPLYRAAVKYFMDYVSQETQYHPLLKKLLHHLDNRQDRLWNMLSELLANREQWLPLIYLAREQSKKTTEELLHFIVEEELSYFKESIPSECREELCSLARLVAELDINPQSPYFPLRNWFNYNELTRAQMHCLVKLLLTSDEHIRKKFDHHVGVKLSTCDPHAYKIIKLTSTELCAKLSCHPKVLEGLRKIKHLPDTEYDNGQWEVLTALLTFLPILVSQLHLLFNERNEIDFTAISQQALFSLGEEENPSDLALYLDRKIAHILVDEFQDTSLLQFELLKKLVQGWEPEDGRTLFLVGDPMQSIYRFRQAEVGLFPMAKKSGLGPVKLTPLELSSNFRSSGTLINWVNEQFSTIFPKNNYPERGAIAFHPSTIPFQDKEGEEVKAFQYSTSKEEAEAIVQLVSSELSTNSNETLAILVRSRTQLREIIPLLKEKNIPFQGMEIEPLSKLAHFRDLWSLTEALLLPANRLAWLSLLRSPLCGLSLSALHSIANFDKNKPILYALGKLDNFSLDEENRLRARYVYRVLKEALAARYYTPMGEWLASTYKKLHGESILNSTQQGDLEQFWCLIERFSSRQPYPDLEQLKTEFHQLYSQCSEPSRLHIMTIHKSKGLEFDSVILPGLSIRAHASENSLLRWMQYTKLGETKVVFSPLPALPQEEKNLYHYLSYCETEKESYELQRLLYVATTRAKKRLYLIDSNNNAPKGSFRYLLKNQYFKTEKLLEESQVADHSLPPLYQLPIHLYTQTMETPPCIKISSTLKPISLARHIGIVAHELLQWICLYHPSHSHNLPWSMVGKQFASLGFDTKEITSALNILKIQMDKLFQDPIGLWLISPHSEEVSEYPLLLSTKGEISTRIIDRSFLDEGRRWIIDFKTGKDEEVSQEAHRQQIEEYAHLFQEIYNTSIHCGLYYLTNGNWLTWVMD